ncbi:methyltransferase domain-containing protein [Dankookia sp. P2]|uniref:methyltransferase domain-containing protein n=1 Tax=Dankookia sp. P2 TaxID=3423955 RepID=UPI003D67065F
MDEISAKVRQMYDQFPYPSPRAHGRDLRELLNLLTLFSMETKYDFRNRAVLDAGTGTGHRLIKAAARLRQTRFTAIDISEKPLSIARQVCQQEGLDNIEFRVAESHGRRTPGRF